MYLECPQALYLEKSRDTKRARGEVHCPERNYGGWARGGGNPDLM